MKNLIDWYESLNPSTIAKGRGMRVNDSTRDKKRLLDQVVQIEQIAQHTGVNILVASDWERLTELARHGARYKDFTMQYDENIDAIILNDPFGPSHGFIIGDDSEEMFEVVFNYFFKF